MKTIKLKTLKQLKNEFSVYSGNEYGIAFNTVERMPNIVNNMYKYFGEVLVITNIKILESKSETFRFKGWTFDKRWIDRNVFGSEIKEMFDELIKDL